MSKELPKGEAKELLENLHKSKKTQNKVKDFFKFLYKITQILFGFAIVALGAAAILYGWFRAPNLWDAVITICGVCTFVDGWVVLWKVAK